MTRRRTRAWRRGGAPAA
uniref:Uncharacterized protein n=1 Tax=Arundo donax TaxID=35708 RepID=A0A0A9DT59_ARUDO